jgi:hypothetical protein
MRLIFRAGLGGHRRRRRGGGGWGRRPGGGGELGEGGRGERRRGREEVVSVEGETEAENRRGGGNGAGGGVEQGMAQSSGFDGDVCKVQRFGGGGGGQRCSEPEPPILAKVLLDAGPTPRPPITSGATARHARDARQNAADSARACTRRPCRAPRH